MKINENCEFSGFVNTDDYKDDNICSFARRAYEMGIEQLDFLISPIMNFHECAVPKTIHQRWG